MVVSAASANPYLGLRPFEENDADVFFGRNDHIDELLARLKDCRFVAVVGTSGSGKSSLVKAGLIPALRGGSMLGIGSHWRIGMFRPEDKPLERLSGTLWTMLNGSRPPELSGSDSLRFCELQDTICRTSLGVVDVIRKAALPQQENLLLVVDQFEEVFRYGEDAEAEQDVEAEEDAGHAAKLSSNDDRIVWRLEADNQANAFVGRLLRASRDPSVRVYILITIRSEFLGECARAEGLPEAINEGLYLVPRLTRFQLKDVIKNPALMKGGRIDDGLVEVLLNDIGRDPDQLPVLQHALMQSWNEWRKSEHSLPNQMLEQHQNLSTGNDIVEIKSASYEHTGGTKGALSDHATRIWNDLGDDRKKKTAELLFRCLTKPGPDQIGLRRPCHLSRICLVVNRNLKEVQEVIEAFRAPDNAFLMPPDSDALRADDEVDTVVDISHESLIRKWDKLKEWIKVESQSGEAYQLLLRLALLYEEHKSGQFLLREGEIRDFLRHKRISRWNQSWSLRYGGRYDLTKRFLKSSRLEHRKRRREQIALEKRAVRKNLIFSFAGLCIFAVCFIAVFSVNALRSNYQVSLLEVSTKLVPDERSDTETLQIQAQHALAANILDNILAKNNPELKRPILTQPYLWQKFSALTLPEKQSYPENSPGTQESSGKGAHGAVGPSARLALSKTGKYLAFSGVDRPLTLFYYSSLEKPVILAPSSAIEIKALIFSPNEKYLAAGGSDGKVRLFLLADYHQDGNRGLVRPQEIETSKQNLSGQNLTVTFSSDSQFLAIATEDGAKAMILSLKEKSAVIPKTKTKLVDGPQQIEARIVYNKPYSDKKSTSLGFSPDGQFLLVGSENNRKCTLFQFKYAQSRVVQGSTISITGDHNGTHSMSSFAFGHDLTSNFLAIGDYDGDVILYSMPSFKKIKESSQPLIGGGVSLAFSPDGRYLAAGSVGGLVSIFATSEPSKVGWDSISKTYILGRVNALAFDKGSRYVAIAGDDGTARIIEAFTAEEIGHVDRGFPSVVAIAFDSDTSRVAYATSDPAVRTFHVQLDGPLNFGRVWGSVPCEMGASSLSSDGGIWAYICKNALYVQKIGSQTSRDSSLPPAVHLKSSSNIHFLAFSRNNHYLAWSEEDTTNAKKTLFFLKNLENGHNSKSQCEGKAYSIALNRDGTVFACGLSGEVSLFRVTDSADSLTVDRFQDVPDSKLKAGSSVGVSSLAFSDNGSLAIGTVDSSITVYQSLQEKPTVLQRPEPEGDKWSTVSALAFSSDGKSLIASQAQIVGKPSAIFFNNISSSTGGVGIWTQNSPASIAFSQKDEYVALADSTHAKLFLVKNLDPGKNVTSPSATLTVNDQITTLTFDKDDKSLIISTIAYRDLIGVKRYKYRVADLISGVCSLLPPEDKTFYEPAWKKTNLLTVGWLGLKPPTELCK